MCVCLLKKKTLKETPLWQWVHPPARHSSYLPTGAEVSYSTASWWRLPGVRMTCRDRTSEFQSACKSLQGRPVRWHGIRTPSHCPVLVDGTQQFTHVLFTLINVTSCHGWKIANYIKCKHVFPPVAEWSPAHQTGSQRPQAAQRLHCHGKVRNAIHSYSSS